MRCGRWAIARLDPGYGTYFDTNTSGRALAAALIRFAEETSCQVVAEGVETQGELGMLRELRVNKVQGYLIGRPMDREKARELVRHKIAAA